MKMVKGWAFPDADDYLAERLPDSGVWQQEALDAGLMYCDKYRVAVDGGAHVGTWSKALSLRFKQVFAFEPAKDTFACLVQNMAGCGVDCRNEALGATMGIVATVRDLKDIKRRHTGARYCANSDAKDPQAVLRVTLDSLQLEQLDFIKLDLEGGEPDAIKGGIDTLARCKPVVVFERGKFAYRYGYGLDASEKLLASIGAQPLADLGLNLVWGWV